MIPAARSNPSTQNLFSKLACPRLAKENENCASLQGRTGPEDKSSHSRVKEGGSEFRVEKHLKGGSAAAWRIFRGGTSAPPLQSSNLTQGICYLIHVNNSLETMELLPWQLDDTA
ncbi:hypothetical protein MHYP_G00225200 [Metynnis hypsauchen]